MTSRAADEARVKPVHGAGAPGRPWLNGRVLVGASALAMLALFAGLWRTLRPVPLPRVRADFPAPPELDVRIAVAQDRLKADPQDIAALVELGTLQFEKGKDSYVDAINSLEQARDLGALDPRIFYCLGIMYQEEGLYPFALTEYQRFLRHYPENKEVRQLEAKLYYRMGLFPEAVGEYERLKFTSSGDPLVEENLGLSLWAAKQTDRAKASFGLLLAQGGEFGRRAEFYLGQIALEAGQHQEALAHFERCGAGTPLPGVPDKKIYAGLGMAQQTLGRYDEAKATWEAVLKSSPKDPKALSALREVKRRLAAVRRAKARKK